MKCVNRDEHNVCILSNVHCGYPDCEKGKKMSNIPKEYLDLENDFGFTATDDPLAAVEEARSESDGLAERLTAVEKLVMPLLVNLMKNPEKENIRWPNRKEQVEAFVTKLLKLTRG